jgi:hypothetical protein
MVLTWAGSWLACQILRGAWVKAGHSTHDSSQAGPLQAIMQCRFKILERQSCWGSPILTIDSILCELDSDVST